MNQLESFSNNIKGAAMPHKRNKMDKQKMTDRDEKIWAYLGDHLLHSRPEYLQKQFGIKMGFCSKLPKAKKVKKELNG